MGLTRFVEEMKATLPPGFGVTDEEGIIGTVPCPKLCDFIRVSCIGRRANRTGWAKKVEFLDRDGDIQSLVINAKELGKNAPYLGRLRDMGFRLYGPAGLLDELLRVWDEAPVGIRVDRCGYLETPQGEVFVRPDGVSLTSSDSHPVPILLSEPMGSHLLCKGTFEKWCDSVAAPAIGNDAMIFVICAALAGPLLKPAAIETVVFNLTSSGSEGRSALLALALSCDRSPETLRRWSNLGPTEPGDHALAHDGLLALDALSGDLSSRDLKRFWQTAEDGNFSQNADDRRRVILSSCEEPTPKLLGRRGKAKSDAVTSRFIDLHVGSHEHGVFQNLAGHSDVFEFLEALRRGVQQNFGHLVPAFIQHILNDRRDLGVHIRNQMTALSDEMNVGRKTGDRLRQQNLRRFALLEIAGELAIDYHLLPWPPGTARSSVRAMVSRWDGEANERSGIEQALVCLHRLIEEHRADFVDLDAPNVAGNAGQTCWHDNVYFYLSIPLFLECLVDGQDVRAEMVNMGVLHPNSEKNSFQFRMPPTVARDRPRVYRISKAWYQRYAGG